MMLLIWKVGEGNNHSLSSGEGAPPGLHHASEELGPRRSTYPCTQEDVNEQPWVFGH